MVRNPARPGAYERPYHPTLVENVQQLRKILISLVLSASAALLRSQTVETATAGTEFWTGFMQNAFGSQSITLIISAQAGASGTISMPLSGWSTSFSVGANSTIQVSVPVMAEHTGSEAVANKGIHIESSANITVMAYSYQNFTTDAMQVFPVTSLGTTYRAEAYRGLPGFAEFYKSELLVVATQDGTQISITPSVLTIGGHPANVPFTINLNAGQSYQVQSATSALDLTGTLVQGTAQNGPCRPFVVLSGSMCANVPVGCPACDHICEQMMPTDRWGTLFHTIPFLGTTQHTYRVLAHQAGTQVSINGGAPITLGAGGQYQVNANATAVCITATQPVSVVQLMEGFNCATRGDPSMVSLLPDDRKSTWVRWRTVNTPQMTQHAVGVLMATGDIGGLTLDGNAVGGGQFQAYPACPGHSFAMLTVGVGDHILQAPGGFIAYASGTGTGESYALPISNIAPEPEPTTPVLCSSAPVTLTVPEPLANIAWTTASAPGTVLSTGTSYTFLPTANDVYMVDGSLPLSGCPRHYEWEVGVAIPPVLDILANGQATMDLCQYQGVQLEAVPAPDLDVFDLSWTPAEGLSDAGIADPMAWPMTDTWYKLHLESPVGCGGITDSIFVNVLPNDVIDVDISIQDSSICAGDATQMQARAERVLAGDALNGAPGPLWASLQGGSLGTQCGAMSGDALRFDGDGTRRATTGPLNVTAGASLRFALLVGASAPPCDDAEPGDDILVEYSLNGINWTAITTLNEAAYPAWTPVVIGIPAGALSPATRFRWSQLSNSGAGTDVWALDDVLITRYDNTGLTVAWSPTTGLDNAASFTPQASPALSTTYTATVSHPGGCSVGASASIQVSPAFNLSVTPDTTVCTAGSTIPLMATPSSGSGITYSWAPAAGLGNTNIAGPAATPLATTTYTVTATSNIGCTDQAEVTITVGQLQSVDVTASDIQMCQGEQSILNAAIQGSLPSTVTWTPLNAGLNTTTGTTVTAGPTATTTYTATVTENASGCQVTDAITINMSPAYTVNAGPDATLCTTLGHQLHVVHNVPQATIQWSNGALLNDDDIQSPTIMFDTTATYTVTVTDVFGCSTSDQITITDPFDLLITPVFLNSCDGDVTVLDAQFAGLTYDWSTGATTQVIPVSADGMYVCTITDAQGCQAIATYIVTYHELPAVDLGPDTALCGSPGLVLSTGAPGESHLWSTQETTEQITVTTTGAYGVTVTTQYGCTSSDAVMVDFNDLPVDPLQDIITCETSPPVLDAQNPGCTYLWSNGETLSTIVASSSGTYTVAVTTADGCTGNFDATVTLMPEVVIDLGPDTALCIGQVLVLDAGVPGIGYAWSTGSTDQQVQLSTGGLYSVAATNGACSGGDEIAVTFNVLPQDVLVDAVSCVDQPVVLDAGNPGCVHLWSNGTGGQQLTVTVTGTYGVTITNTFGCSINADATVTFSSYPVVELGQDTVLCDGDTLRLDAGMDGSLYTWSTGATTRTLDVTGTGRYVVSVGNGLCTSLDSVFVAFNPRPDPLPMSTYFACLTDEPYHVVIDAGNPQSSHQWSTGETAQYILAGAYGWYFVSMTNQFECSRTDSAEVREFCPPSMYVPNTFTPNGDGINDTWRVVGKNIGTFEIEVFDRWGGVIFRSESATAAWDGTIGGSPAANDVYVWRMRYRFVERTDGSLGFEREQMGHVTVLR